jgi:flagellar hook-basal body complex protein FliE
MRIDPLDIRDRVSLSAVPGPAELPQTAASGPSFDEILKTAFQNVGSLQKEANRAIQRLSVDGSVNVHQTMIAMEKANLSFRLMLQIRNKLVDAYQEVMRMQV